MITKIDSITGMGVFGAYSWDAALPSFSRFNVFYGDNGSGKTTLSRLLAILSEGSHPEHPNLDYRVTSETGVLAAGVPGPKNIRVFNSDYVAANIGQLDGPLKHILVVGEENKELAEALKAEEKAYDGRNAQLASLASSMEKLRSERGRLFTQVAKLITEAIVGSAVRNYRKPNAEAAFEKMADLSPLTETALGKHRSTLSQDVRPVVALGAFIEQTMENLSSAAPALVSRAHSLCGRSAISDSIARLREQPDIAAWVEHGFQLHRRTGHGACEFCGQLLPQDRWDALTKHFSADDQALKEDIEGCLADLAALARDIDGLVLPDSGVLYPDIAEQYDPVRVRFAEELASVRGQIAGLEGELFKKLGLRTTPYVLTGAIDPHQLAEAFSQGRAKVMEHNARTEGFADAKALAAAEIERHHLASIKPEVDQCDAELLRAERTAERLKNGDVETGTPSLAEALEAIQVKRSAISNAHRAGASLTERLHTFLGRKELVFQSGDDGYRVFRHDKPAQRLSEGERTAIAFIYFLVQLGDQGFSVPDGIVVIDDPVSSLDASASYQAFAFLKNAVQGAKQVFLLTHNFGFLRLALNWLENTPGLKKQRQCYMLICSSGPAGRVSRIAPLDSMLQEHPTEYHYLFRTLATFKSDGTLATCYHMPNICRKVLEAFLDFHVPARASLYAKLQRVDFPDEKKTAIYKLANDLSHFSGQDFEPGLVQESQKTAEYLLEMIRAVAPKHYEGMMEYVRPAVVA